MVLIHGLGCEAPLCKRVQAFIESIPKLPALPPAPALPPLPAWAYTGNGVGMATSGGGGTQPQARTC